MQWAGWAGIYDLGMQPGKRNMASISSGHKYALNNDKAPFFCEGFNYVDNTKCTFLRSSKIRDISPQAGQTASGTCFISSDNPNPCALGASDGKKWALSVDGKYYFVTNSLGMMEYVEVGPSGPSKCGTSKTVFATQTWSGRDNSGKHMPDPATTCSDATCRRCVDHMLGRSMAQGMLPFDNMSTNGNCKLVTAARVAKSCDGEKLRLGCPSGEHVIVTDAKYGRQPASNTCAQSPDEKKLVPTADNEDSYKTCWADVTSTIEEACAGRPSCAVTPGENYANLALCKKVFSYLQVEYTCTTRKAAAGSS